VPEVEESEDVMEFTGRINSEIETKFNEEQDFNFQMVNGVAKFNNGLIYNGTWNQIKYYDTNFKTGELFNKEGKLVGKYTDGKFESVKSDLELQPTETENTETIPAVITYPFEWNTTSGKWTIYNEGNKVYYFNKKSTWTSIDKQEFENKVVSGETITFVPIVDEAEQTRLDGLFSKTHRATNTTPVRPTSKKKYIVIKNNVTEVNLYTLENNKFKFYIKLPPERSDKTTGNRLVDTKQLPIQGGNDTRYKMYNFKSGGSSIWIPERFVTIVER